MYQSHNFYADVFGRDETDDYEQNREFLASKATFKNDVIIPSWQSTDFEPALPTEGPIKAGIFRFDNVEELRNTAFMLLHQCGYTTVNFVKRHAEGDSRQLHQRFPNALFQAASQFNCLEFVSPQVTPKYGITIYQNDRTQGPACAIACAGATAFRNYLVPVADNLTCGDRLLPPHKFDAAHPVASYGQTDSKQLNGLADLEPLIWKDFSQGRPMWTVKNGYIELTEAGVAAAPAFARRAKTDPDWEQRMINSLRVGCQFDSEVTDRRIGRDKPEGSDVTRNPLTVAQVFASACSIGYSHHQDLAAWEPLSRIVLKAAYEATFYAYLIHICRCQALQKPPGELLLTKLGGGVFANPAPWIQDAMIHAQKRVELLFQQLRIQPPALGVQGQALPGHSSSQPADGSVGGLIAHKRPPFMFRAAVTHYRGTEAGYQEFVDAGSFYANAGALDEEMRRVPSFLAGLGSGLVGMAKQNSGSSGSGGSGSQAASGVGSGSSGVAAAAAAAAAAGSGFVVAPTNSNGGDTAGSSSNSGGGMLGSGGVSGGEPSMYINGAGVSSGLSVFAGPPPGYNNNAAQ